MPKSVDQLRIERDEAIALHDFAVNQEELQQIHERIVKQLGPDYMQFCRNHGLDPIPPTRPIETK